MQGADQKFYSIFFKKLRFPKAGPLVAHRTASRSEAFRSATAEGGSFSGELPPNGRQEGAFYKRKSALAKCETDCYKSLFVPI